MGPVPIIRVVRYSKSGWSLYFGLAVPKGWCDAHVNGGIRFDSVWQWPVRYETATKVLSMAVAQSGLLPILPLF